MGVTAAADHRAPDPGLPFAGARIDRVGDIRHDPEQLEALLDTAPTLAVYCEDGSVLVEPTGELTRVPWSATDGAPVLLGVDRGHPLVGVDLSGLDADRARALTAGRRLVSLREAGTTLAADEAGVAAYLVALLGWHRAHPFCARCGSPTTVAEAGLTRRCESCGTTHFPRTDPVVIMTVESEGRLLMGTRTGWDPGRFSVLAGFVAPGETPEDAVVREVREESGITCADPRYVAAQPWPFPSSLMLVFHATARGGQEPAPGADGELAAVRWFSRGEIRAMQRGESPLTLPGEVSIARMLVDRWAGG